MRDGPRQMQMHRYLLISECSFRTIKALPRTKVLETKTGKSVSFLLLLILPSPYLHYRKKEAHRGMFDLFKKKDAPVKLNTEVGVNPVDKRSKEQRKKMEMVAVTRLSDKLILGTCEEGSRETERTESRP